jgi:uncharacterized protein
MEPGNSNLRPIVQAILEEYALPLHGYHGVAHWARVLENGRRLSAETGANIEIVSLFAVFHDSRRVNEGFDPYHGTRGAEFAKTLRGRLFDLVDDEFEVLHYACSAHTDEDTHPDVTIQTCWDSDRLDLGRVGIVPDRDLLCTDAAKTSTMISWAHGRASFGFVPPLVADEWGIALAERQRS